MGFITPGPSFSVAGGEGRVVGSPRGDECVSRFEPEVEGIMEVGMHWGFPEEMESFLG